MCASLRQQLIFARSSKIGNISGSKYLDHYVGIDDLSDVCNTFNYLLAVWNRLQRNMSTERFYARGVPLVSPAIVRMPRTALLMLYVSESRGRGEGWKENGRMRPKGTSDQTSRRVNSTRSSSSASSCLCHSDSWCPHVAPEG